MTTTVTTATTTETGSSIMSNHDHDTPAAPVEKRPALLLAEYETPTALAQAAAKVRDAGYSAWDCHTPYPVHGMDEAMGLKPTKLAIFSFFIGITGVSLGFLMIWWMNAVDYPIVIGGKPPYSFPSMVPILFECGILFCGFGTLFTMLGICKLPTFHHPIFNSDRFEAATDDKFFISIEAKDPKFDITKTRALLDGTKPSFVELVEEEVL